MSFCSIDFELDSFLMVVSYFAKDPCMALFLEVIIEYRSIFFGPVLSQEFGLHIFVKLFISFEKLWSIPRL